MSLINQMLRDLDKRRGPVNGAHIAALQGMGLINTSRFKWYENLSFAAWSVVGLLAIVVSYQASIWWNNRPEPEAAVILPTAAEVAEADQNAQLDTVTTQDNFDAAAPAAITKKAESPETPLEIAVVQPAEPLRAELQTRAETTITPVKLLTPQQKSERLFRRAQQALSSHRRQGAEQLLQQALDEYARHIAARSQLAALLLSRQQAGKAERLLAEGLATDPHQLALARPYAQLLAARDELVPALETLDRALDQRQPEAETLALRAAILYRLERHTESAAAYRTAVLLQPDRALWWTGLAVALEQDGRSRQALEAFQRAAELPLDKPVDDYVKQRTRLLSDKNLPY